MTREDYMADCQRERMWTDGEHTYCVRVWLDGQEFRGAVQREGLQGTDAQAVGPMVMENLPTLVGLQESVREQLGREGRDDGKPLSRKKEWKDGEHKYRVLAVYRDGKLGGAVQREGPQGTDTQVVAPMVMENLPTLIGLQESASEQLGRDRDRLRLADIDRKQLEGLRRDREQPYDLGDLEPLTQPEPTETEPSSEPESLTHLRHRTKHGTGAYCGATPESERHLLQSSALISTPSHEDFPVCDRCRRQAARMHSTHDRTVYEADRRKTDDIRDLARRLAL